MISPIQVENILQIKETTQSMWKKDFLFIENWENITDRHYTNLQKKI